MGGRGPAGKRNAGSNRERAMDLREFAGYAAGTAFVLAVAGLIAGGLVLVVGSVPILLLLFPLTLGALGVILLVGYIRHRARRRWR